MGSQGYKAAKEIIKLILSVSPQPPKVTNYLFLLIPVRFACAIVLVGSEANLPAFRYPLSRLMECRQ